MTAPAPDRRCGTCKWWDENTGAQTWGACVWTMAHMPASMRNLRLMREDQGTDCSQWSDGAEAGTIEEC